MASVRVAVVIVGGEPMTQVRFNDGLTDWVWLDDEQVARLIRDLSIVLVEMNNARAEFPQSGEGDG